MVKPENIKELKKKKRIVLLKEKKLVRSRLLADLKQFQLRPDQLAQLHSTSSMQTAGLKKFSTTLALRSEARVVENSSVEKGRWQRGKKKSLDLSSSSSEDTDAISTDTEEQPVEEKPKQEPRQEPKQEPEQEPKQEPKPEPKQAPCLIREPVSYVPVLRRQEIEKSRLELPIINEEHRIMDKIRHYDIVIVTGETGSGKTTQIPQFLYEAGYAENGQMIGVTEPRRVAAVSMSERVASELNLTSDEVSYQIRFSGNTTSKTKIKFMTDGVLLRECRDNLLLPQYSAIIIDEAHERSIFSDILIGLLSRIVPMRRSNDKPLKLVIMSATLRVSDFLDNPRLFHKSPPVINIETRQYPVTVQFAKKTPSNYLQAAYMKVCSVHSKMPRGGILVFVTSQMDVKLLCKKLREKFPYVKETCKSSWRKATPQQTAVDWSDIGSESEDEGVIPSTKDPLHCLGLYAMLPLEKQRLVFKEPPEGTRLCVVATNVAETSITIPNIRYVIDTGKEKTKVYDLVTGVSRFITTWTSKSSAEQRMGRAGRTGPGYCYRLYSSAVFSNDLPDHAVPRILQKPVEDIMLQMKTMCIDNVVNFPFPTRPSVEALKAAEKKLLLLGALTDSHIKRKGTEEMIIKHQYEARPTPLGFAMANFSLDARCSKMIVLAPSDLLPYVISLVSAMTVREMFLGGDKWHEIKKKWAGHGSYKLLGDFMVMLRAISKAGSSQCSNKFCHENGLRTKAMLEIDKLRRQLTLEVNKNLNYPELTAAKTLKRPTEALTKILRQLLLTSHCDRVARKIPNGDRKLRHAYESMETDTPVYISTESSLKGENPNYVIYRELYQGDKKMYMRDIAVIEPDWLPQYAPDCPFAS